jgi:hypothetical protein
MKWHALRSRISSQAHYRLHAKRMFNGVPCGRGVVLGEARQMYVGDVGNADACWMLLWWRGIGVGVERASVGFGCGCGRGRVG